MAKHSPIAEMRHHSCKSGHFWFLNLIECFLDITVFQRGTLPITDVNYVIHFFSFCDMWDRHHWELFYEFAETLSDLLYL